jgi:hypothetical protein
MTGAACTDPNVAHFLFFYAAILVVKLVASECRNHSVLRNKIKLIN